MFNDFNVAGAVWCGPVEKILNTEVEIAMKYFQTMRFSDWLNDDYRTWNLFYRIHATRRMFERNFTENDLFSCLDEGIIIKVYDEDQPYPSLLINGTSDSGRALHIVIGIDRSSKRIYIITVYEPDPDKWFDNFSRRLIP